MNQSIRHAALTALTLRSHSEQELRLKLRSKGFPDDEINVLLSDFKSAGLINDRDYIEQYIRSQRNKGYGPRRIEMGLITKGLSATDVADFLQITDNSWLLDIKQVWRKHFKGTLPQNFKEKAKQMRYLQARGFTHAQINALFDTSEFESD